jgi:small subunit ribosomal protein S20
MPIIKSAKKALKVSRKKQVKNNYYKGLYSESRKAFEKAIKISDVEAAKTAWFNVKEGEKTVRSGLQSMIDKLVKKNIIHKNNAARKKAKFAKMLKGISL